MAEQLQWVVDQVELKRLEYDGHESPPLFNAYGFITLTAGANKMRSSWIVNSQDDGTMLHEIPWPLWDEAPTVEGPEIPEAEPDDLGNYALAQLQTVNWQSAVEGVIPDILSN